MTCLKSTRRLLNEVNNGFGYRDMEINLEELREAVALMREFERIAEKVAPMFQALKDSKGVIVPTVTDRFVSRGDVCKILKIGSATLSSLIASGQLTPLYIGDSITMKFRLSEVESLPVSSTCPKSKKDNLTAHRERKNSKH